MRFVPNKAKVQKTNKSRWLICFVLSVTVIKALFGLQSAGQKTKTQAWRRRYGQTLGIGADTLRRTPAQRPKYMMNDVWAREVALH